MKKRLIIQLCFLLICAFFMSLIAGSFIHEGAHIVMLQAGGSQLKQIVIMPGIQLYPEIEKVKWSGYVVGVALTESSSQFFSGLSLAMGSTANAIASYLLLVIVFLMRRGWRVKLVFLLSGFVLAWDLIAYSIFPLFGLRHWIFIGGNYAEPIKGASMLGIPLCVSYLVVFVHVIFYHFVFGRAFLRFAKSIFEFNHGARVDKKYKIV
jgi:hypothetical protein